MGKRQDRQRSKKSKTRATFPPGRVRGPSAKAGEESASRRRFASRRLTSRHVTSRHSASNAIIIYSAEDLSVVTIFCRSSIQTHFLFLLLLLLHPFNFSSAHPQLPLISPPPQTLPPPTLPPSTHLPSVPPAASPPSNEGTIKTRRP